MPVPALPQLATYNDVLALPDGVTGEIIDGGLHTEPRPTLKHARASTSLTGKLWSPFDEGVGGPGGWWILDEPELHLNQHILVPDLAGWRRENLAELTDTAFIEVVPNWALRSALTQHSPKRPQPKKTAA